MKKSSLILCISSLLCASIYSSEWNDCDTGPSKDAFKTSAPISQAPLLRSPAVCGPIKTSTSSKTTIYNKNARMHELEAKVTKARREIGGKLFDHIPEYKKQENPKRAFMRDYCFSDLEILAKAHQEAGFYFDSERAIQQIVFVAPEITDAAFEAYETCK